jgi:TP901 family phage tail tape measure protein
MAADVQLELVLDNKQFLHEIIKSTGALVDFSTKAQYSATALDKFLGNALTKAGSKFKAFSADSAKSVAEVEKSLNFNSSAKNNFGLNLNEDQLKSLPRLRYALYDISAAANQASQAMLNLGTSVVSAASSYESSFTNVQRTLDQTMGTGAVDNLKQQLKSLGEQIPLTFDQITSVATLGSQLGIASSDLTGFTETVSKFSSVTNVSAESAAQSFGALGELLGFGADQYNNFGSAVAYAGTKSVATESEILSVATQIGGVAGAAGFSAEKVVGLSTALASLRIPAEQSRGALTRVFQEVNRAAAEGGLQLQNFASILGVSVEEAKSLATTDMPGFFDKFVKGMQGMDPGQMTQALDALNLSELRVTNTLTRLASNYNVVAKSQDNASKGFQEGTFLTDAYGIKADDLASKIQIMNNTFQNLIATIGDGLLPILKPLVDAAINVGKGFEIMMQNNAFANFAKFSVIVATLTGVVLTFAAVIATAVAGTFALTTAFTGLVADGILAAESGLARVVSWFLGIDLSALSAAAATDRLSASTTQQGATAVGAAVATEGQALATQGLTRAQTVATLEAAGLIVANQRLAVAGAEATGAMTGLQLAIAGLGIVGAVVAVGSIIAGIVGMNAVTDKAAKTTSNWANTVSKATSKNKQASESAAAAAESTAKWDEQMKKMGSSGGGAGKAADKIRTLIDYANDLSAVFSRALDIRFSSSSALDGITKSFSSIAKSVADAREEVNGLNADIQSLTADKALQEYFLTVAEAYGDTLKAQEIRANLAKIDVDLTKKTQSLQKAQDKTNKTLLGNSDAAVDNRAEIIGLVKQYEDYVKSLASSGMKQDELRAKTAQLKADFIAQATQLGYNQDELAFYAKAFDDVTFAINNVPRNVSIEVDIDSDPAVTAFNEILAAGQNTASGIGSAFEDAGDKIADALELEKQARIQATLYEDDIKALGATFQKFAPPSLKQGIVSRFTGNNPFERRASGGPIYGPGTSTSDSIPAMLSNGEYVIRASAVKQYGVGFFNQLNQMKTPRFFSGGGPVTTSGGGGIVSLSPEDRALLRNVGGSGNIVLYADSKELARSVNDGNRQIVASGGRP